MARTASPETRRILIERAAAGLARLEPVTLRSLAAAAGVSTMAVYTHFDGMDGLWAAVRQDGFDRLGRRLAQVRSHADPVRHLADLGVAYTHHALANPNLYRVMFDASFELPDPAGADASFEPLVASARSAQEIGRFSTRVDPRDVATRYWASGHGLISLTLGGVLPRHDLERHAPALAIAVFVSAGDQPERASRSVRSAWRSAVRLT